MPLPFLPGDDGSVVPTADDLPVAVTVGRSIWAGELTAIPGDMVLRSWLDLTAELPAPVAAPVARGYHQVRWRHTNQYRGECGGELEDCPGFSTRRCPQCSTLPYVPNAMSPVAVVAVEHDGRLLLVRQAYGRYQDTWDLVAGLLEPGETLEGTAIRELWEETGLVADQLTYAGSHPRSFGGPSVLLAAFTATVTDPMLRLDPAEIAEARWFSRAELRELPSAELPPFPYTMSLIHRFLEA